MLRGLLLVAAVVVVKAAVEDDLSPSCHRPVYCDSQLLHHVQMARLFNDSKTFVDLELVEDEETTLIAFQQLLNETNNSPTRDQLQTFVDQYFTEANELDAWTPNDFVTDPKFLYGITDEKLRQYGKNLNAIWPNLGRKVKQTVIDNPNKFSLIPVTHGFIIPGGRFKELYYWDAYWIIEGLLVSGMQETVKGMLENFLELLRILGHIPNGSRWYYEERSQPPLLTAMVSLYFKQTRDIRFLKANIEALEEELQYWLDTQIVTFDKDGESYTLLRYYAPSEGPRPESYYEDYTDAQRFQTKERQTEFYIDIKSGAESGWDFSSRWFVDEAGRNSGNLSTIHTIQIIPVDLNAIFANALQTVANFRAILGNPRKAVHWAYHAKQWRSSIEKVLWNEEDGTWYDYDIGNKQHRKYFYPSNLAPLWMKVVDKRVLREHTPRIVKYVQNSPALAYPGGIPASMLNTGEQWDFPNAWPPLISIVVNALETLDSEEAKELAFDVAQTWVRACHKGFLEFNKMFEKYNVEFPGLVGGGGEYTAQEGFGWSNGVVLEFLSRYGRRLTAEETPVESTTI